MRPSGEKARAIEGGATPRENPRFWSRWRVAESSISTPPVRPGQVAMKPLHGDHAAWTNPRVDAVAAALLKPHDSGTPRTTLTNGWACDLYSFCTIDSLGVSTSAE